MKPFLKWLGNKYAIIERIKATLPVGNRLIEPFVGSGSVFLNTDYQDYLLADINGDLIDLFTTVKEEGDSFIQYTKSFFQPEKNNAESYYKLRERFNSTKDNRLKSAIFLYLNKHGFNGLFRYNSKGKFNVAFGSYTKPYFPEEELKNFYNKAQTATFITSNFIETMEKAVPGDIIYCDPPYVALSDTANFTGYNASTFGEKEQNILVEIAEDLSKKGIPIIISNQDTAYTKKAYKKAEIIRFDVQRFISCNAATRNKVGEVIAVFK